MMLDLATRGLRRRVGGEEKVVALSARARAHQNQRASSTASAPMPDVRRFAEQRSSDSSRVRPRAIQSDCLAGRPGRPRGRVPEVRGRGGGDDAARDRRNNESYERL